MAGSTHLFDLQQDCISIAVDPNLGDLLSVTAYFSLSPQPATASTEVNGITR
jgi:hypothetical protein